MSSYPTWRKRSNQSLDRTVGYTGTKFGPGADTQFRDAEYQATFSHGNKVSLIGSTFNSGGEFYTEKCTTSTNRARYDLDNGTYYYRGPFATGNTVKTATASDVPSHSTTAQLNAYGTQAIARCSPTNPLSGMGQFLGELRDLPKLVDPTDWHAKIKDFRKQARRDGFSRLGKKAADEYLNAMFGWVPFISDLRDFASVVKHHSPLIQQYARNSGRHIRRRYSLPAETTTAVTTQTGYYPNPVPVTPLLVSPGIRTTSTTTSRTRWFSGAFTYYLPNPDPNSSDMEQFIAKAKRAEAIANKLFGTRLSPELLYKLTPWSWAADWLTTSGSVVHNWQSFALDGLVMHYGYVMETVETVTSDICRGARFYGNKIIDTTDVYTRYVKQRAPATPYGFGANPASFTAKQWSIIAALGISKKPRSL